MASKGPHVKLDELLKAVRSIRFRAETQSSDSNPLDNFIPIIDFETLLTPNLQIIYGRNGTGKTHLLLAFQQYCEKHFDQAKTLPVYIDCKDLDLGPVLPSVSIEDLILRFYRRFLFRVIERLRAFADSVVTPTMLSKIFKGEDAERKKKIDQHLSQLTQMVQHEQIEQRVKDYIRSVTVNNESLSKVSGNLNLSSKFAGLKMPSASVEAGSAITAEDIASEKDKVELVYRGLCVIEYDRIRDLLEEVISLCGASSIVILVDEWSSIGLSLQPMIAEMIRKTLTISDRITLKIVACRFTTQTSASIDPPQSIGFQPGIDIQTLADLDRILNFDADKLALASFLTDMAYKHALRENTLLRKLTLDEFQSALGSELFEDEAAYFEVVRASEGNPRDFLVLLSSCCNLPQLDSRRKISKSQTIGRSIEYFNSTKSQILKDNQNVKHVFDSLFRRVVLAKTKLFLLSSALAENDARVQQLWHYRFIHLVEQNLTFIRKNGDLGDFHLYSIDYGKLLTLKTSRKGQEVIETTVVIADSILRLIGGLPSEVLRALYKLSLKSPFLEKLEELVGAPFVAYQGVEDGELDLSEELLEKSVFDDVFTYA